METSMITLKIRRLEDVRRVTLSKDDCTWEFLQSFMKKLLAHITEEEWSNMHIYYIDDEQDRCTISSEEELKEAISLSTAVSMKPLLKLFLVSPETRKQENKCPRLERLLKADGFREEGLKLMDEKQFDEARRKFEQQCEIYKRPLRKSEPLYNIACCYALLGDTTSALNYLRNSVKSGFRDVQHLVQDEHFVSIRSEPTFQEIVKELQSTEQGGKCHRPCGGRRHWGERRKSGERKCGWRKPKGGHGDYSAAMELQTQAFALMITGNTQDLAQALELFRKQAEVSVSSWHRRVPVYNMACCEALLGNSASALGYLRECIDLGYKNVRHMEDDSDLKSLRGMTEFQNMLDTLRNAYPTGFCDRRRHRKTEEPCVQEPNSEDPYDVQFEFQFPAEVELPAENPIPILPDFPLEIEDPEDLSLPDSLLPYVTTVAVLRDMGFVNMDVLSVVVPEVLGNPEAAVAMLLAQQKSLV